MDIDEYQKLAERTANFSYSFELALGLPEEAGEVVGILKKAWCHGHPLDKEKLVKELGDCLWYLSMLARLNGVSMSEVASKNIEKLKKRYPDGFSKEASINRKE